MKEKVMLLLLACVTTGCYHHFNYEPVLVDSQPYSYLAQRPAAHHRPNITDSREPDLNVNADARQAKKDAIAHVKQDKTKGIDLDEVPDSRLAALYGKSDVYIDVYIDVYKKEANRSSDIKSALRYTACGCAIGAVAGVALFLYTIDSVLP